MTSLKMIGPRGTAGSWEDHGRHARAGEQMEAACAQLVVRYAVGRRVAQGEDQSILEIPMSSATPRHAEEEIRSDHRPLLTAVSTTQSSSDHHWSERGLGDDGEADADAAGDFA